MKVIGLKEADLDECVREAQHQQVLLTRKGKPVALLVGVQGMDVEQIERGCSDAFWTLLRERRGQRTMSRAELEKRLTEP